MSYFRRKELLLASTFLAFACLCGNEFWHHFERRQGCAWWCPGDPPVDPLSHFENVYLTLCLGGIIAVPLALLNRGLWWSVATTLLVAALFAAEGLRHFTFWG